MTTYYFELEHGHGTLTAKTDEEALVELKRLPNPLCLYKENGPGDLIMIWKKEKTQTKGN